MSKGIFRHKKFKTFLTRGLLRPIFKPFLYTKEDNIHSDFIEVLNNMVVKINRINLKDKDVIIFWLVIVPRMYFEEIFIEDENNKVYLDIIKYSTENNGKEGAYITQAYVLWILQQMLTNKPELKEKMSISIEGLEILINHILGKDNKVQYYLEKYRNKFDLKKLEVDPRDWPIIYIGDICQTLINDTDILKTAIKAWNDNIIEKMKFIAFDVDFFGEKQKQAIKLAENE